MGFTYYLEGAGDQHAFFREFRVAFTGRLNKISADVPENLKILVYSLMGCDALRLGGVVLSNDGLANLRNA